MFCSYKQGLQEDPRGFSLVTGERLGPHRLLELPKGAVLCLLFLIRGAVRSRFPSPRRLSSARPHSQLSKSLFSFLLLSLQVIRKQPWDLSPLFFTSWLGGRVQGHGSEHRLWNQLLRFETGFFSLQCFTAGKSLLFSSFSHVKIEHADRRAECVRAGVWIRWINTGERLGAALAPTVSWNPFLDQLGLHCYCILVTLPLFPSLDFITPEQSTGWLNHSDDRHKHSGPFPLGWGKVESS